MASLLLVIRLNKVDLPTLGRPTSAITGFILSCPETNAQHSVDTKKYCRCMNIVKPEYALIRSCLAQKMKDDKEYLTSYPGNPLTQSPRHPQPQDTILIQLPKH